MSICNASVLAAVLPRTTRSARYWVSAIAAMMVLVASLAPLPVAAAPAAEPWPMWQVAAERCGPAVDHSAWTDWLGKFVQADATGLNRVDYQRASKSERAALRTYIEKLTSIDPRNLCRTEQMPYWINLYNSLTVDLVLANPKAKSIRRMGRGFLSFGPWDDDITEVAQMELTLNDIEHRILRPIWRDHRIHYAVNCASVGCPNLATVAYTAQNTEALLAQGETEYINHARGVTLGADGRLTVSSIYDWYASDFASDEAGLLQYLAQHHVQHGAALAAFSGSIRYDYDWDLNSGQ